MSKIIQDINQVQDRYFGNQRGIVRAQGSNGYCKIFFPGIFSDSIATVNLPWAEPAQPLFAGGAGSNGVFQYPDIGATIWAFFEGGNVNYPVYFAATNNNKNKFVIGENSIQYNNISIKLEANNNVSVTTTGIVNVNASTINSTATSTIGINAPTVNITSPTVNINATQTSITGTLLVNGVPK